MKTKIIYSLIAGIVLAALSLYIIGGKKHLDPMAGCSACVMGSATFAPGQTLSHRGFPFTILYLQKDDDSNINMYRGYAIVGAVADIAIGATISFVVMTPLQRFKNSKPTN